METRLARKRKEADQTANAAPAKRTRSAIRTSSKTQAPPQPAPKPSRARRQSSRAARTDQGAPAAAQEPPAAPALADAGPSEPPAPPSAEPPQAPGSGPDTAAPQDQAEDPGDMDRGRRGSRREAEEAPSGDDVDGDVFGRNFSSAGSALQGLLRKLGAGFEDMLPLGMSGTRIKGILASLRQADDETSQLAALTELCELLSISTEESLAAFPVEQTSPLLVQLLGMEHNPDMMLLAARALTFMADVLPASCGAIVRHGAVPVLCQRLLSIEYIDLAEQSLQALDKLSHQHPRALLANGGLLAVLSYVDFFPTGVQRVAVATAANMCVGLTTEHAGAVRDAVPILTNLLQYQDAKVVDNACVALMHIAEAFSRDPVLLELLNSHGLINQAIQLISIGDSGGMTSQLSVGTYYGLVKLLATCASGSHVVAENLLQAGLSDILRQLLANSAMLAGAGGAPTVLRTADQLYEVVSLAFELLPSIADASLVVLQDMPARGATNGRSSAADGSGEAGAGPSGAGAGAGEQCARSRFLKENPAVLLKFSQDLLPLLLQVYSSTVMPQVRHRCLAAIVKVLYFAGPDMLQELLVDIPISSFIASLLGARDARSTAYALQMGEILMEQLPDTFRTYFVKEGVAHALEDLASGAAAANGSNANEAAAGADTAAAPTAAPPAVPAQQPPAAPTTRRRAQQQAKESELTAAAAAAAAAKAAETAAAAAAAAATAAAAAARPPVLARSASVTLKEAVARRAKRFKAAYFGTNGSGPGALDTDSLRALRRLCGQLTQDSSGLKQLFELLTSANVSVFELLSSGAVNALSSFLRGDDLATPSPARDEQLLQRLDTFVQYALAPGSGNCPPLLHLVRKLQIALSSSEAFPVLCSRLAPSSASMGGLGRSLGRPSSLSGSAGGAPGSLSSGLAALTQPFKLRLVRHSQEQLLKEYPPNIVLIEPLATMNAIEDFLWPRISRGVSLDTLRARAAAGAGAAQPGTGSGDLATAAAAAAGAAGATASRLPSAPSAAAGASRSMASTAEAAAAGAAASTRATSAAAPATAPQAAARAVPPTSKAQPIPTADDGSRRMTRAAAARARAEAQAKAEEAAEERRRARANPQAHMSEDSEEHDEDMMMHDHMDTEEHDEDGGDDDMEDHGQEAIFDDEDGEGMEDDMDDDEGMDIGSMPVHDLHLNAPVPGAAAAAAAAAAPPPPPAAAAAAPAAPPAVPTAAPAATAAAAPPPPPARTAASVAAAAAAPKVVFYMNDQPLPTSATVFQAIQQLALAGGRDELGEDGEDALGGIQRGRGRRLWDEVYTLSYRNAADAAPEGGADGEFGGAGTSAEAGRPYSGRRKSAPGGGVEGGAVGHWQGSPLRELLEAALPEDLAAPSSCLEILGLLQLLEAVNRLGGRLASCIDAGGAGGRASSGMQAATSNQQPLVPGHVPREEFVNSKLGSKLGQQLKDVLSICGGGLPGWCRGLVLSCKFLFPFEVRRRYFYSTAFGLGRALQHMQAQQSSEGMGREALDRDGRELRIGRLQRQKVRVSRNRILDSAVKVMELYAKHRAVLELEYFGEVGTGLGPTLEFYTLLSHELQKKALAMWRHEEVGSSDGSVQPMAVDSAAEGSSANGDAAKVAATVPGAPPLRPQGSAAALQLASEDAAHESSSGRAAAAPYVNAPWGLFPSPLKPSQRVAGSKVVEHFRLLGRTVAKALQDSRMLDLPLSYVFYRAALGHNVDLHDVAAFDPSLGQSLERLQQAASAHVANGGGELLVDGARIEDLCLTFTLPGYPDYELRPGGADTMVDASNLQVYIDAVVDATLHSGVAAQLAAFRDGFCEVFPLRTLDAFREDEIETLVCGAPERWTAAQLAECIKFDHGYTSSSAPVRHLLETLSEMDASDQRRFLRFVTGCPRLPPGGVAALQPRLTVVRKHPSVAPPDGPSPGSAPGSFGDMSNGTTLADGDLPSVMTCANYIKLPPYSSKEVLRERLMFAVREGGGAFHLS